MDCLSFSLKIADLDSKTLSRGKLGIHLSLEVRGVDLNIGNAVDDRGNLTRAATKFALDIGNLDLEVRNISLNLDISLFNILNINLDALRVILKHYKTIFQFLAITLSNANDSLDSCNTHIEIIDLNGKVCLVLLNDLHLTFDDSSVFLDVGDINLD